MVFDTIGQAFARLVDSVTEAAEGLLTRQDEQGIENLRRLVEEGEVDVVNPETGERETVQIDPDDVDPSGAIVSLLGEIPEESQELLIQELQPDDLEGAEAIRQSIQEAEGAAVGQAAAVITGMLGIEALGAGQIESHQFAVSQILTFLALEDILGLELETTVAEGVRPRLNQEINAEYRSKQVNLQDRVEADLRNKDADTGWLGDISRYGIKPEQVSLLEEVAIQALEPEELLETPIEYGVIPDRDVVAENLDRAGVSEGTKELFLEIVDNAPRVTATYEERTVAEELVNQLDSLTSERELTPGEAAARLPPEVAEAEGALRERFELLRDLPAGSPSQAEVERSLTAGYTDLATFRERLTAREFPAEQYDDVVRGILLDELDGDLQEAVGLGLLEEGTFSDLAEEAGLDDETIELLLQGQSFTDIAAARLEEATPPSSRSVRTIVGIGESRGASLSATGIETVADLAGADPEAVAQAAGVSPAVAAEFIQRAQNRVN